MFEVFLGGILTLLGVIIGNTYQSRENEKQRKADAEQREKDRQITEEQRKADAEQREKDRQIEEENKRREFLVATIKDEKEHIEVRKAAAQEYLDKQYNGVVKAYIFKEGLHKNNNC